jgi:hypothetical protein
MAKKSMMTEALDAAKSVGGAALGAAAVAATGVVVTSVAGALRKRGQALEEATPHLQKLAADTVSKPLLPTKQKRAAATRKAKTAKKRVAAKKVSTKRASNRSKKR